jgi:hypothetical protein
MKKFVFLTGDFVFFKKNHVGMIIAKKRANNTLLCKIQSFINYQWVYYILCSNGNIEGPVFSHEIDKP